MEGDDLESTYKEIGVSSDILPRDSILQQQGDTINVVLPIAREFDQLCFLGCSIKDKSEIILLKQFALEVVTFLLDFIEKRHTYLSLREKHDKLL